MEKFALMVLVPLVALFLVRQIWMWRNAQEARRRGAAKLAAKLREYGLVHIPNFLECYSVGDYTGMLHMIGECAKLFTSGEAKVMEEFSVVFNRVLEKKLATVEGRAYLKARVTEAEATAKAPVADHAVAA